MIKIPCRRRGICVQEPLTLVLRVEVSSYFLVTCLGTQDSERKQDHSDIAYYRKFEHIEC